ncbi:MAG TPA: OmpH family outer membrane protein [Tepidisphaeraceae bacterium]|nr:OmpH family outer membrane protein [Tepidisphaeraceae bacterium]
MRKYSVGATVITLAGLVILLGFRPTELKAAPPGQADHQLAIGVVNTTRVLRNMDEAKRLEADFRAQQQSLQAQQQQKEQEIGNLEKHRESGAKPGSDQWNDETNTIDTKRADLEVWRNVQNVQLERQYKRSIAKMYDHIAAAAAEVARQQNLDLIIADQAPEIGPDLDKATVAQLSAALAARAVLFSNKKADITEDVLTVVQKNFAQNTPPSGPGPAPLPAK